VTEPAQALEPVTLHEPRNQHELRQVDFVHHLLKTVEVARSYRDVFAPGTDVTSAHHVAGTRMMKDPYVGIWIKELAKHALEAAGVDRELAIRRLLQTIDSDITDFGRTVVGEDGVEVDDGFMSLKEMREKLPLEKRRLIRKYTERLNAKGAVIMRQIELEPKHQALELLARIQNWVSPDQVNVVHGDMIVNVISRAQSAALRRVAALRPAIEGSATATQISRSAQASNLLTSPAKDERGRQVAEPINAPEPDAPV
jgi:hypothetical protein